METRISYDVDAGISGMRECGFALGTPIKGTADPIEVRIRISPYRGRLPQPYSFRTDVGAETLLWSGVFPSSYEIIDGEEFAVFVLDPNKAMRCCQALPE